MQKLTSIMRKPIPLFAISLCFVCCSSSEEEPVDMRSTAFAITDLVVSGKTIYAAADRDGIFRLEHWKDSWQRLEGLSFTQSLAVSGTTVYAADSTVYCLDKDSDSWVGISETDTPVSPTNRWGNASVVSLLASDDEIYAGMGNGRLYRSIDNGRSWSYVNREWQKNGLIKALFAPPIRSLAISGTTLYAGTDGEGVFRSLDGGDSWAPVSTGLTEQTVKSLAVSGTTVYAGTLNGVFRLDNGADSWTHAGLSGLSVISLVVSGTRLYVGALSDDVLRDGVFRSVNGGISWTYWGLCGFEVEALVVSGEYLYAGTLGRTGILRRATEGYDYSWTPINRGLTQKKGP